MWRPNRLLLIGRMGLSLRRCCIVPDEHFQDIDRAIELAAHAQEVQGNCDRQIRVGAKALVQIPTHGHERIKQAAKLVRFKATVPARIDR